MDVEKLERANTLVRGIRFLESDLNYLNDKIDTPESMQLFCLWDDKYFSLSKNLVIEIMGKAIKEHEEELKRLKKELEEL